MRPINHQTTTDVTNMIPPSNAWDMNSNMAIVSSMKGLLNNAGPLMSRPWMEHSSVQDALDFNAARGLPHYL